MRLYKWICDIEPIGNDLIYLRVKYLVPLYLASAGCRAEWGKHKGRFVWRDWCRLISLWNPWGSFWLKYLDVRWANNFDVESFASDCIFLICALNTNISIYFLDRVRINIENGIWVFDFKIWRKFGTTILQNATWDYGALNLIWVTQEKAENFILLIGLALCWRVADIDKKRDVIHTRDLC